MDGRSVKRSQQIGIKNSRFWGQSQQFGIKIGCASGSIPTIWNRIGPYVRYCEGVTYVIIPTNWNEKQRVLRPIPTNWNQIGHLLGSFPTIWNDRADGRKERSQQIGMKD